MARCPQCRKTVEPRSENPLFPFCSERCKLVDLGKWLGGEYRIPVVTPPEGEEEEPVVADEDEPA